MINHRPSQIWYQNIITGEERLIYNESEGKYYLDVTLAKNGKHVIISANSKEDSKIWTIDTTNKGINDFKFELFKEGKKNKKFWLNHNSTNFVLCKDDEIVFVDENNFKNQKTIFKVDESKYETITDVDIFRSYIIVYLKRILTPVIKVIEIKKEGNT